MSNRGAMFAEAARGPILLITLGTLFALQQSGVISFGKTWPALIIVLGILKLFERVLIGPNARPVTPPPYTPPAYAPPSYGPGSTEWRGNSPNPAGYQNPGTYRSSGTYTTASASEPTRATTPPSGNPPEPQQGSQS